MIIAAQLHCFCPHAPFQFDFDGITTLQRQRCVEMSARTVGLSMSAFKVRLHRAMADECIESFTINWGISPEASAAGSLNVTF